MKNRVKPSTKVSDVPARPGKRIRMSSAGRAALERMAEGGESRAALRAKAVLALADGASVAAAARALVLSEKTVRAARARFLAGGAEALPDPGRLAAPPPQLELPKPPHRIERPAEGGIGRPPTVRRRIETYVRDCAALGLFRPGATLPPRTWFRQRFRVTETAIQDAFDSLRRQGFTRSVKGKLTSLADPLPFQGRYLLLVCTPLDDLDGIDSAMVTAVRRLEARRGVCWDVARVRSQADEPDPPLLFDVAEQRYAGVFLRSATQSLYSVVDHVPICGVDMRNPKKGSHVRSLVQPSANLVETVFRACARAGCRHPFVLDAIDLSCEGNPAEKDAAAEKAVRSAAEAAGLGIPPDGYFVHTHLRPAQLARTLRLALSSSELSGIDSAVSLQDNLTPALSDALAGRRDIPIFSQGSFPNTIKTSRPVEWHGDDWEDTLGAFIDWCEAIRDGGDPGDVPPPPSITRR